MNIIKNTQELDIFCSSIEAEEFITIDTEFIRENTYFPKLYLIQIAAQNNLGIVDPLASDIDYSSLNSILQNQEIVKVFHAGKQDLEIILKLFGKLPTNFFDTQIAAAFCGYGISVSYETLVKEILNISLDKTHCLSDWSQRPLSQEQLKYAAADVLYLRNIYQEILPILKKNNRLDWVLEDMSYLNQQSSILTDVNQVWKKIKGLKQKHEHQDIIKSLAIWRENKAKHLDLPRNKIINDHLLIEISEKLPINSKELEALNKELTPEFLKEIVSIVNNTLEKQILTSSSLALEPNKSPYNNTKSFMKIKNTLLAACQEHDIPLCLLANSSDIKSISLKNYDVKTMRGWRYELVGKLLLSS